MMKDRFGIDWTNIRGSHFWARPQLNRRLFFRHISSAVGGYFLLPSRPTESIACAAGSPIGTAKNIIFVLMSWRAQPLGYVRFERRRLDAVVHGSDLIR